MVGSVAGAMVGEFWALPLDITSNAARFVLIITGPRVGSVSASPGCGKWTRARFVLGSRTDTPNAMIPVPMMNAHMIEPIRNARPGRLAMKCHDTTYPVDGEAGQIIWPLYIAETGV